MTSPFFARRLFASLSGGIATGVVVFAVVFLAYYVAYLASGAGSANAVGLLQAFGPSAVVVIVLVVVLALPGGLITGRRALLDD